MAALVWLIAGVLLIAAEVLSGDFVLLMIGLAALAAAGSSALGAALLVDAIVFGVASVALIALARPAIKRRLLAGDTMKMHTEALVGAKAVVLSTVDSHGGQVKLGGEVWTARSYDETQVLEPGSTVTVMSISGATAIVWSEEM
ncbi:NfeD family protein [Allokutzneria sp. A3M-2-11 16]|uniref:NfeD family protein n=1 Tax=Allokutzneria sp. A3M-2-11 16 TaxID=2962043 RepID=UPI0020B83B6A|nr:NfeD family protein [Allokutzneria sp. A3M-2-11 16]MCP3802275.1 NfeD family protein [Allokutzneria sp. A3M-2-11 16]